MKVYFSHGKESGPWGFKIQRLSEIAGQQECGVESIDYTDLMDPDLRVERLLTVLAKEAGDFILVGSSMGGYVSLVASERVATRAVGHTRSKPRPTAATPWALVTTRRSGR